LPLLLLLLLVVVVVVVVVLKRGALTWPVLNAARSAA
jgi:hypothetical protein